MNAVKLKVFCQHAAVVFFMRVNSFREKTDLQTTAVFLIFIPLFTFQTHDSVSHQTVKKTASYQTVKSPSSIIQTHIYKSSSLSLYNKSASDINLEIIKISVCNMYLHFISTLKEDKSAVLGSFSLSR